MNGLTTRKGSQARLIAFMASSHLVDGTNRCKLGMFTNDINPGRDVSASAFTPLTGTAGEPQPLSFAAPVLNDSRTVYVATSGLKTFKLDSTPTTPVTVYGCYLVSATDPTMVLMAQRFPTPQVLTDTEDVIQGLVQLTDPDNEIGFILMA